MRGDINIGGAGGVEGVNGLIERYKVYAGENVSAGDFVEFVNSDKILISTSNSYNNTSAVVLDENRVFVIHRYPLSASNVVGGMICTVSGTNITAGTDVMLVNRADADIYCSAVLIDVDKICVIYARSSKLGGIICTISGTTITPGTDTLLVNSNYAYYRTSTVLVDTNKVFVAHRSGGTDTSTYSYLNGIICTISGTTITPGTDTTLVSLADAYEYASAVLIDTNKVFIAHRSGGPGSSSAMLSFNGIVCTMSETTITPGTDTNLVSKSNNYQHSSTVLVDTNKVFVAHRSGGTDTSTYSYLNGIICTISGTTITPGTDTTLVSLADAYEYASAVLIDTNKVFIAHRRGGTDTSTYSYLNGIICTISGTTITPGTDTTLVDASRSNWFTSAVLIDTNKVFIAHRSGGTDTSTYSYLNGIVVTIDGMSIKDYQSALPITSPTQTINGVANTSGSSGQKIEVYVPEVS